LRRSKARKGRHTVDSHAHLLRSSAISRSHGTYYNGTTKHEIKDPVERRSDAQLHKLRTSVPSTSNRFCESEFPVKPRMAQNLARNIPTDLGSPQALLPHAASWQVACNMAKGVPWRGGRTARFFVSMLQMWKGVGLQRGVRRLVNRTTRPQRCKATSFPEVGQDATPSVHRYDLVAALHLIERNWSGSQRHGHLELPWKLIESLANGEIVRASSRKRTKRDMGSSFSG
jgi:hypothetical protein